MKHIALIVVIFSVLAGAAYAGPEQYSGKEMKQVAVPPPCPEWYADQEFNLSIWGTYVFSNHNNERQSADDFDDAQLGLNDNASFVDLSRENSGDRYLETSHAWGGGIDFKYFFHRYFGVGVEGFLLDARRTSTDISIQSGEGFSHQINRSEDRRAVGGALGTFTLRYPFRCSRFAPYAFAGAGAMFNGGERDLLVSNVAQTSASTDHQGTTTKAVGQFGGGLEVRFTRHIGLTSDFSWNVIDGPRNNFGMVRSGLNFAF